VFGDICAVTATVDLEVFVPLQQPLIWRYLYRYSSRCRSHNEGTSDSIQYRWSNPGGSAKLCRVDEQTRLSLTHLFRIYHTSALCNEYPYIQTSHPPNTPLRAPSFSIVLQTQKTPSLYQQDISRPIDWALVKRYTVIPNPKRLLLYI
jgi:hypothetical protein